MLLFNIQNPIIGHLNPEFLARTLTKFACFGQTLALNDVGVDFAYNHLRNSLANPKLAIHKVLYGMFT